MSARHIHAGVNAGYMMEDLVLKLTELDIDTCWLTFTDSDKIKKALSLTTPLEVAAIVAFGYGEKTGKKLRMKTFRACGRSMSGRAAVLRAEKERA